MNPSNISAMNFLSRLYPKKTIHCLIFHVRKPEGAEIFSDAN